MDATAELKNKLISRIKESKNVELLKAMQTIFDNSQEQPYSLSSVQEASIEFGREEIKNKKCTDNDKVISDMKQWLSKN